MSKKESKDNNAVESCFVIMPFGGVFDHYYNDVFKPAISAAGLSPIRSDDLFRASTIIKDIWELTQNARVILADLSKRNPNVFYELGLAHAINKPVILVSENKGDIPLDLRHQRVILYNKDNAYWGTKLKEEVTNSITETLEAPDSAVMPVFLTIDETKTHKTVSQHEKEILELKQDVAQLKMDRDTKGTYWEGGQLSALPFGTSGASISFGAVDSSYQSYVPTLDFSGTISKLDASLLIAKVYEMKEAGKTKTEIFEKMIKEGYLEQNINQAILEVFESID